MKITVRLSEPFWRTAGCRETTVGLAPGQTVAQAVEALLKRYPALAAEFHNGEVKPWLFVNDLETDPDMMLTDGAILHVVWPISGG